MTVSRDEVFEILRGVVPRLEEALPGWSVRPNITGTGAVGLYLDGPAIYRDGEPLAGVNAEGEPVVRHLCGTIQTADRGQYILGVSVAEHESEYPELADLASVGEPSWVPALRALEALVGSEGRETLFVSRGGYVPGRRVLGKRRVALRREFFPGKPWLGLGTIDWCAGVRSTPVYAEDLVALVAAATRLASGWGGVRSTDSSTS